MEGSLRQTHVDHGTVWKYMFKLDATPGRTYSATCFMLGLARMQIVIAPSGATIYRVTLRTERI